MAEKSIAQMCLSPSVLRLKFGSRKRRALVSATGIGWIPSSKIQTLGAEYDTGLTGQTDLCDFNIMPTLAFIKRKASTGSSNVSRN
ncbi:MAG: hypothetical protein NVSMB43_10740 [Pseudarthrobacter sp.]